MSDVIVIPTHVSGILFLENLLDSIDRFDTYPILIVINQFRQKDWASFQRVLHKFRHLPISIETSSRNAFEFGGLLAAYSKTSYENFLLLPHSCEIVNTDLFDMVFQEYQEQSVAYSLIAAPPERNLPGFWCSHVGKYRRVVLDQMDLNRYLPSNMLSAIEVSEKIFTRKYHQLDPRTAVLFKDWLDGDHFELKFGRLRMKIANEYIIKWKTRHSYSTVRKTMGLPYWFCAPFYRCKRRWLERYHLGATFFPVESISRL